MAGSLGYGSMGAMGIDVKTFATLGLGEAGSAISRGLKEEWRDRAGAPKMMSVDINLHDNVKGPPIQERARDIGVEAHNDYGPHLSEAEFVISVVTGNDAKDAAKSAMEWLKPGAFYCDVNTLTGPQTKAIAAPMLEAGIKYVDIAAMGGFANTGHRTPFLISGPHAEEAAEWMTAQGFQIQVLSDVAGEASAVKIIRSVMIKGIEALTVECMTAAYRQGLVQEVLDCFSDVDARTFAGFVKSMAVSHVIHAKRRMEEIEKAVENLEETDITPVMSPATIANHRRTVDADVVPKDGSRPTFEEALEILSSQVVGKINQ